MRDITFHGDELEEDEVTVRGHERDAGAGAVFSFGAAGPPHVEAGDGGRLGMEDGDVERPAEGGGRGGPQGRRRFVREAAVAVLVPAVDEAVQHHPASSLVGSSSSHGHG